jgi:hypothetical protein
LRLVAAAIREYQETGDPMILGLILGTVAITAVLAYTSLWRKWRADDRADAAMHYVVSKRLAHQKEESSANS